MATSRGSTHCKPSTPVDEIRRLGINNVTASAILIFLLLVPRRAATLLLVAIAACTSASAQPVIFSNPDQFLVDKETDFVAIVTVTRVENRWVVLPDGDHVPIVIADSTMDEVLSGTAWPVGRTESTMQFDYNDLRRSPARFAHESMDIVRAVVRQSQNNKPPVAERSRNAASLPGLSSRLGRGPLSAPLLDGLADPDPEVRRIVIEALALAGNPDAVKALNTLVTDRDVDVRAAVRKAIAQLGPIDR
jgi:hypothetical protein